MTEGSVWPRGESLRLEGVTVRRGAALILDGVDLAFEPGRRYVLIGASGAGKSTLLRLLNRLDDPEAGRVAIGEVHPVEPAGPGRSAWRSAWCSKPLDRCRARCSRTWATRSRSGAGPCPILRSCPRPWPRWASTRPGSTATPRRSRAANGRDWRSRRPSASSPRSSPSTSRPRRSTPPRRSGSPTCWIDGRRSGLRTIVVTHNREMASRLGDWTVRLEAGKVVDQGPTAEVLARADGSVWADFGTVG